MERSRGRDGGSGRRGGRGFGGRGGRFSGGRGRGPMVVVVVALLEVVVVEIVMEVVEIQSSICHHRLESMPCADICRSIFSIHLQQVQLGSRCTHDVLMVGYGAAGFAPIRMKDNPY